MAGDVVTFRIRDILTVYTYAGVGFFLLTVPWSPVWEAATLVIAPTTAGEWARGGGVRGFVSGLGGLNLWVAFEQGARLWRAIRDSRGEVGGG